MESALTTSPSSASASSTPSADLPVAVGPTTATTSGTGLSKHDLSKQGLLLDGVVERRRRVDQVEHTGWVAAERAHGCSGERGRAVENAPTLVATDRRPRHVDGDGVALHLALDRVGGVEQHADLFGGDRGRRGVTGEEPRRATCHRLETGVVDVTVARCVRVVRREPRDPLTGRPTRCRT